MILNVVLIIPIGFRPPPPPVYEFWYCPGGSGSLYLSSGYSRTGEERSLPQDLEFDLSELGSVSDLMSEDETEPIPSFSLTSTSLSRYKEN